MTAATASPAIGRWMKAIVGLALGWITLVLIVAIVQTTNYTGFVGALSEWQFDHLGQAFPAMTFLLLFALFALPGLLLLGLTIRRINVTRGMRADALIIQRSTRMLRVLVTLTTLLGLAALIFLVQWAMLPNDSGKPMRVDMRSVVGQAPALAPIPVLPDGPTQLIGDYRYERTATFRRTVLVAQRDYRFVPVQLVGTRPGSRLVVFAETSLWPGVRQATAQQHVGVLHRGGLPPAVAHLYRDAGFSVASDAYVLYPDRGALTWPYIAGATQLAIATLLLLGAAVLTRRRLQVLRDAVAPITAQNSDTPASPDADAIPQGQG